MMGDAMKYLGEFLIKFNMSDNWANTLMLILIVLFGLGSLAITALAATQNSSNLIQAVFFGIAIALVGLAFTLTYLLKEKSPLRLQGLGNARQTGAGMVVGFIIFAGLVLVINLVYPNPNSPANILPVGAIVNLQDAFNIAYLGLFAPVVETLFFVGVLFPTIIVVLTRFEFTRRLFYGFPFGEVVMYLLASFFVAALFTGYHTYAYAQGLQGSPNFLQTYASNLFKINIICLSWIFAMQLSKSIAAPIMMHMTQNFFAVADYIQRAGGHSIGIFDLLLYVVLPLLVIYGLTKIVTPLLPRVGGVRA